MTPVRLARSSGFKAHELRKIEKLVVGHETQFLEAWNEYFNT
ncbi:MAG: DUF4160 domain-containing protein [Ardenticatenaceae bacterium]